MIANLERRAAGRASGTDTTIEGLAVPFGVLSGDLGGFREVFTPEAVDRTLAEQVDVRALVDHDPGKVIGRVKAGTLRLRKASDGLRVEITPPNTTLGRDILELVRRGDVSGMSIGFYVMPGGERFETRGEQTVRVITDARIVEASIVSWPAYESTDATVAQRSLQAFRAVQGQRIVWLRQRARLVG